MSGKVLALLLRSRFSRGYLGFLVFIAFLDVSSFIFISDTGLKSSGLTYSVIYLSVFLILLILITVVTGSGSPFSKSDQDFLLQLPIPKKTLIYSIFLVQFLSFGAIFFILSLGAVYAYLGNPARMIEIGLDGFLLGFLVTPLAISTYNRVPSIRIIVGVGVSALIILGSLGFPYSPISMYHGYPIQGNVVLAALLLVSIYFSIVELSRGIEPKQRRQLSSTYSYSINYERASPYRAVMINHFSVVTLAGQGNGMSRSGRQTFSGRLRLPVAVMVMGILAAVFSLVYILSGGPDKSGFTSSSGTFFGGFGIIILFYLNFFPTTFFMGGVIPFERFWITATAFQQRAYYLITVGSKMLQTVVLEAPFVAAIIIMDLIGYHITYAFFIILLVITPLYVSNFIIFSSFARPVQVTENGASQGRSSARNFIAAIPTFVFAFSYFLIIFIPIASLVPVIIFSSFLAYSAFKQDFWDKRVMKLVERGYV